MERVVRGALIQCNLNEDPSAPVEKIKKSMIDRHIELLGEAKKKGAQVACMQELFYGPYFCAEQVPKWYDLTEPVPNGPTTKLMQDVAKQHGMVLVVPLYEEDLTG